MPKRTNDGIRKLCGCARSHWPKCDHPWHFNFHQGGKEYRFSLNKQAAKPARCVIGITEARKLRDDFRVAITSGTFKDHDEPAAPAARPLTFNDVADVYLRKFVPVDRDGRPRREAGQRLMRAYVERLKEAPIPAGGDTTIALKDKPFADITKADVLAIRDGWKRRTGCDHGGNIGADRALKRLRHLFNWAIEEGYTTTTPFRIGAKTVIHFKTEKPRRRRLQEGEEDQLIEHATSPLIKAIIVGALDTGMRRGELLALQWHHVNLAAGRIDLPGEMTKTGEPRTISIVPKGRLAGVLEMQRYDVAGRLLPATAYVFGNEVGERVTAGEHRAAWLATCEAAKIRGLQFRDLRRTFASELHETPGVALLHVSDALGHADVRTTNAYLASTVKKLDDAMRRKEAHRTAIRNGFAISPAPDSLTEPDEHAENPANLLN